MAVTKQELVETITPLFKNLSDKINHISELLGKDIETLKAQSREHYTEADKIKEKIQIEVDKAKEESDKSIKGIGERVGTLEQHAAVKDTEITAITKSLDETSTDKRWGKEMWLIISIAIVGPIAVALLLKAFGL